jgi:hypothetical protein
MLGELQRLDDTLRVDAPELVALERVSLPSKRPPVARANQLVAVDVPLGEIMVEVRAPAGRAAHVTSRARHSTKLIVFDLDGNDAVRRDAIGGDANHDRPSCPERLQFF